MGDGMLGRQFRGRSCIASEASAFLAWEAVVAPVESVFVWVGEKHPRRKRLAQNDVVEYLSRRLTLKGCLKASATLDEDRTPLRSCLRRPW